MQLVGRNRVLRRSQTDAMVKLADRDDELPGRSLIKLRFLCRFALFFHRNRRRNLVSRAVDGRSKSQPVGTSDQQQHKENRSN